MRTDVKLGVAVAMVVVTVAGGYYMYRDRAQQPILIAGQPGEAATEGTAPAAGKVDPKKRPNPAARNTLAQGTKRPGAQQRLNQPGAARGPASTPQTKRGSQQANRTSRQGNTPADAAKRAQQKRAQQLAIQRQKDRLASNASGSNPQTPAAKNSNGQKNAATPKLPPVRSQQTPVASARNKTAGTKPVPLTATKQVTAAVEKHRVQPGDTLSSLAVQYYGSERHTRMLIDANKQLGNPDRLKIGEIVNLPSAPADKQTSRSSQKTPSTGARSYTVRSGDSFYVIAESQLGDASRWNELYELNRAMVGSNPASLKVGQVLRLPSK